MLCKPKLHVHLEAVVVIMMMMMMMIIMASTTFRTLANPTRHNTIVFLLHLLSDQYFKLKDTFCELSGATHLKAGHSNNVFVKRELITSANYVADGCGIPASTLTAQPSPSSSERSPYPSHSLPYCRELFAEVFDDKQLRGVEVVEHVSALYDTELNRKYVTV